MTQGKRRANASQLQLAKLRGHGNGENGWKMLKELKDSKVVSKWDKYGMDMRIMKGAHQFLPYNRTQCLQASTPHTLSMLMASKSSSSSSDSSCSSSEISENFALIFLFCWGILVHISQFLPGHPHCQSTRKITLFWNQGTEGQSKFMGFLSMMSAPGASSSSSLKRSSKLS